MSRQFVIVGPARSGSTLLVRTLDSLEGVCCHGELLADMVRGYQDGFDPLESSKEERDARAQRLREQRDSAPAQFILEALRTDNTATGFKALYGNLLNPRWKDVVAALRESTDTRFIHLRRINTLRRFVSEQILQAGGPNHSGAGGRSEQKIQVHVDIAAYQRSTDELHAEENRVVALLAGRELLDISYEQLSTDTAGTVAQVCHFLGMDTAPGDIQPALQKVGATDLRETVSNFEELLNTPATRELALAN